MLNSIKEKLSLILFISILTILLATTIPVNQVIATSLSTIEMAIESKISIITEKGNVLVEPVRKAYFYTENPLFGLPVTFSKSEVPIVPGARRINLIAKKGTFYYLSHRTAIGIGEGLLTGINDPIRFYVKDIDMRDILKCRKEGEFFNCDIEVLDLFALVAKKPEESRACFMFVGENKEEIQERFITTIQRAKVILAEAKRLVFNLLAGHGKIRVFCVESSLADRLLQMEKLKEESEKPKREEINVN